MKHQSFAQEQFEGALITLLLDHVIQRQGDSLLAEAECLNADPTAKVPDALDKKCRALIRRGLRRQKKQQGGSRSLWKTTLLVAITAALLAAAAFASIDELRVGVLNLMLTVTDTYTGLGIEVTFPEAVPQAKTDLSYYALPEIPEGYELVFSEEGEKSRDYLYQNAGGDLIDIEMTVGSTAMNHTVDTEDAKCVENVDINGFHGICVVKGNSVTVTWVDTNRSVFLNIRATGLDRVEVLNMALTIQSEQPETDLSHYTLPAIPDGFTPMETDQGDSQRVFLYVNNKGEKLFISVSFCSSGENYTLDTENADVVLDVLVNGYQGLYVEKGDITQVAWLDTDHSVILHVLAYGEVGQQVMAMAKQMYYQPAGNTDLMNYALPAIPEDYQCILTSETERARSFFYENASQDMIVINIYQGSPGTVHAIDTEDADCVLDIAINGYEGLYVEKGDSTQIAWLDTDHSAFLDIWAGALTREQVLSMAQEMVYSKNP